MSKENKKTVEVYKQTAYKYLENSAEHDRLDQAKADKKRIRLENLIEKSFSNLSKGSKILEIGSGDGSNAKFIKNLGFKITASDTADDFINATKEKGIETIKLDALEDELPDKYSGVFCWRVFVHFTKEDASKIINKVYNSLDDNGIFIFNAINREIKNTDEEWIDFEGEYHMGVERYYSYFRQEELDDIISKTNFKIENFYKEGGDENNKWLIYVLKK